eukprot:1634310-Amphidinium_carterae.1
MARLKFVRALRAFANVTRCPITLRCAHRIEREREGETRDGKVWHSELEQSETSSSFAYCIGAHSACRLVLSFQVPLPAVPEQR